MNHLTVGILGGSFNPMTTGHVHIANNAMNATKSGEYDSVLDEIWLMPCSGHTFGKKLLPAEDRIKMINMTINSLSKYRVCEYEILNKSNGSTYETLTELNKITNGLPIDFYYIIGSDNSQTMEKWINYKKLISEFKFIVIPRPGYTVADWAKEEPHIISCGQNMRDISSTKVRNLAEKKEYKEMRKYVFPSVADYIESNDLYLNG